MYLIKRAGLMWLCVMRKRLVGDGLSSVRVERCRVENEEGGTKN